MWTLIWDDNGEDRWDRLETKEDVKERLESLRKEPGVCIGDVYIFPPESDAYAMDYAAFLTMEMEAEE